MAQLFQFWQKILVWGSVHLPGSQKHCSKIDWLEDLTFQLSYIWFFSFFLKLKGTFERNWILVLLRSRMWPGIRDIPEGILWWKHRVWVLNEAYLENSLCCFLQVQFIKVLCRPLFYQFVINPGIKVGQCDMENIDQLLWGNVSITF